MLMRRLEYLCNLGKGEASSLLCAERWSMGLMVDVLERWGAGWDAALLVMLIESMSCS